MFLHFIDFLSASNLKHLM